jgi:hypothetical protein
VKEEEREGGKKEAKNLVDCYLKREKVRERERERTG